jgi:hypothetical protein
MKALLCVIALSAALAAPAISFAQSVSDPVNGTINGTINGPVTRAQVQAELAPLERAGYNPAAKSLNYPADIQAAEARVHAQDTATASTHATTVGDQPTSARGF